jgi:hypothetical protein
MKEKEIAPYKGAVVFADQEHIFVKPLCDYFGINYTNQSRNIKNDEILKTQVTKKSLEPLFGDKREHLAVSRKGFVRWIQIINAQLVRPELKVEFAKFQLFVFEYLYSAVEGGNEQLRYIRTAHHEISNMEERRKKLSKEIREKSKFVGQVLRGEIQLTEEQLAQIEGGE